MRHDAVDASAARARGCGVRPRCRDFGPDLATNPTAAVVYVLLWVGIVPASLLVGPAWRLVNPLRTVHRLIAALLRTPPTDGARSLPARLGWWPAAAGLLAFTWLELAAPEPGHPCPCCAPGSRSTSA